MKADNRDLSKATARALLLSHALRFARRAGYTRPTRRQSSSATVAYVPYFWLSLPVWVCQAL